MVYQPYPIQVQTVKRIHEMQAVERVLLNTFNLGKPNILDNNSWQGAPVGKKRKNIWIAAPICLFWIVWHKRNMLVFENRATSDQRTKFLFLSKLWTLANTHSVEKMYSLVDFLTWLGSR